MSITLTPTADNTKIALRTPYTPAIPERAKALGGRWEPASKTWVFDARDTDRVRELTRDIFGIDPLAIAPPELVTVRLTWSDDLADQGGFGAALLASETCTLFGRTIARRPARDSAVQLGDNVVLVEGQFAPSGGSARYPAIMPYPHRTRRHIVLEIRDVPRAIAEREVRDYPAYLAIVDEGPITDPVATVETQILALAEQLSPEARARVARILLSGVPTDTQTEGSN